MLARAFRWLGGTFYSLAHRIDPPAPLVATEREAPSELDRARELIATMQAARAEVGRQLDAERAAHHAYIDLAKVREQRATHRRRDSEVLTFTRGELRHACKTILADALDREIRRFQRQLVKGN
jgi:hypothetical protein